MCARNTIPGETHITDTVTGKEAGISQLQHVSKVLLAGRTTISKPRIKLSEVKN